MNSIHTLIIVLIASAGMILPVFAEPVVEIQTAQEEFHYGDHLSFSVEVSEITGDDAKISITDPNMMKSPLVTLPISAMTTTSTAPIAFDVVIWKPGEYILYVEYAGVTSSTKFSIVDTGEIQLPFWIHDLAKMWANGEIRGKDFARAIEFLIQEDVIKASFAQSVDSSEKVVPEWLRNNAIWWVQGDISDADFKNALEHLVKKGIIKVSWESENNLT